MPAKSITRLWFCIIGKTRRGYITIIHLRFSLNDVPQHKSVALPCSGLLKISFRPKQVYSVAIMHRTSARSHSSHQHCMSLNGTGFALHEWLNLSLCSLADPVGEWGRATRRASTPITVADLWFLMPQTLNFLKCFRSLFQINTLQNNTSYPL